MAKKSWYEIKAQANSGAEIYLYDEIGGWGVSAKDFVRDLKALSGQAIALHIHSPGGSVLDGHAIYNALLRHKGGLTVQIDGLAASMAGVIAMSGRPVRMAENAFLMIHNPWSFSMGDSEQMRKDADLLDRMRDGLVNIYAQKTGKDEDEIEALMDAETWFTAEEAKEAGFVDEVTDSLEMAASFDLKKFSKVPSQLVDTKETHMSDKTPTEPAENDWQTRYAAAAEQARVNFSALQAMTADRDAIRASLQSLSNELAEIKLARDNAISDLATFKAADTNRINDEATRALAAAGHPVLNVGGETSSGADTGDSAIYENFTKATPLEATRMLNDSKIGPRIRAESARRFK